jgi:SAM-dependent methyltransferase
VLKGSATCDDPSIVTVKQSLYYWLYGSDRCLARLPRDASILDVGCSDGRGSALLDHRRVFGIDIDRHALSTERRAGLVAGDIRRLPYRDQSFDAVVALDVIEHLEKPQALTVLSEMERVARMTVIVSTPSGFLETPPAPPDEPWHDHKCGFEPAELENLGYTVSGFGGPKNMRADGGWFRWGPLGMVFVATTEWHWSRRPERAFMLRGVKSVATHV